MTYIRPTDERGYAFEEIPYTSAAIQRMVNTQQLDINVTEVLYNSTTNNLNFGRYIVYEYMIMTYWNPTQPLVDLSLELWEEDVTNSIPYAPKGADYRQLEQWNEWQQSVVFGKFFLPVYEGSRRYKLRGRTKSAVEDCRLHRATIDAGLEIQARPPLIKMYTI